MKDVIEYKEFIGSVRFSADDEVFHGKIEGIDDLVSYEGTTVVELKKNFCRAVDDYIVLCGVAGKKPVKSCKGTFNVRIPADLHQAAVRKATLLGVSLNQVVKSALERDMSTGSKGIRA
jgi:predicted HicB family RNase H-like nuclease